MGGQRISRNPSLDFKVYFDLPPYRNFVPCDETWELSAWLSALRSCLNIKLPTDLYSYQLLFAFTFPLTGRCYDDYLNSCCGWILDIKVEELISDVSDFYADSWSLTQGPGRDWLGGLPQRMPIAN